MSAGMNFTIEIYRLERHFAGIFTDSEGNIPEQEKSTEDETVRVRVTNKKILIGFLFFHQMRELAEERRRHKEEEERKKKEEEDAALKAELAGTVFEEGDEMGDLETMDEDEDGED